MLAPPPSNQHVEVGDPMKLFYSVCTNWTTKFQNLYRFLSFTISLSVLGDWRHISPSNSYLGTEWWLNKVYSITPEFVPIPYLHCFPKKFGDCPQNFFEMENPSNCAQFVLFVSNNSKLCTAPLFPQFLKQVGGGGHEILKNERIASVRILRIEWKLETSIFRFAELCDPFLSFILKNLITSLNVEVFVHN